VSQHARLSYLVRQAQLATYQRLERTLRDFALTPAQYTVLAILSRRGESLSSAALSRRLGVSPQSANEIVASALGLLRRTQGAENRRVRRLELTLRGRNLLVQCDAEVDRFEEALFGVLAAPERETLRRLLIKVIAAERSAQATEPLRPAVAPAKRGGHAVGTRRVG
jgi:MarR family transcriptional regulator, lower aerobic nicotinate degradation pathway regulator